ncbi:MAG: hypothetical protein LQ338_004551 [Usnochroma carphineum]|nr:MAG: hypothetical protein LQ338_004551 [Usnochroma carphineum]
MADNDVKQLEQCEFEVLVPQATDLDIDDQDVGRETTPGEERHADAETQRPSELSSIPLRTSLHFAIRSKPQKPFPALPALSARVRYSKSGTYTGRRCIIASLDIETAPFQNDEIQLKNVEMQLSNGVAEDLCKGHAINLPMVCQPRDNLVFLFRLLPDGDQTENPKASSNSKALDISIDAYVFISGTCRPYIRMRWRSLVDFSTALNPKFGGPTQAMQRNRRPSTLAVPSDTEKRASDGVNLGESNEDPPATQRTSFHDHFGLTLTLTAPKDVYIGRPFTWDVFLVNRSPRPRNLVILVIPKRVPSDHKNHITRTSMSSTATVQAAKGGKVDHAEAVLDENRLYALQKGLAREDVGVVSLSTEVRVGYVLLYCLTDI